MTKVGKLQLEYDAARAEYVAAFEFYRQDVDLLVALQDAIRTVRQELAEAQREEEVKNG